MRDLVQSTFRLCWAMSLLSLKQLGKVFSGNGSDLSFRSPADSVPHAQALSSRQEPGETSGSSQVALLSDYGDLPTSGPISSGDSQSSFIAPSAPITAGNRLNTSRVVVLGEGLAAGVGDFSLTAETQPWSFAAQMTRQMTADFQLPLIQAPGIGDFVGFQQLSVRVPSPMQSTVLTQFPPGPVANLAVPGFRLQDAVELRAMQPLVHRNDMKQTAANLIWGLLPIAQGQEQLPTQLEYALQRSPTFSVVELGYYEALEAAVNANAELLPSPEQFASHYSETIARLRNDGSEVLALTIPDPFDTAHFSTVEVAARIARVEASFLRRRYGLKQGSHITLKGLNEIGFQIFRRSLQALPPGSVIEAQVANAIQRRIEELNGTILTVAQQNGGIVYDLAALFRRIAGDGFAIGNRALTNEYLGGFYLLNGYYPGQTGQAIIANEILQLLNSHYGSSYSLIDLKSVIASDPAAACKQAQGALWTAADLENMPFNPTPGLHAGGEIHNRAHCNEPFSVAENWTPLAPVTPPRPSKLPLQLPPGLEQVLPLSNSASYFGDGISALNVRNPQQAIFGSTGNFIFGGLAMVDSHLSGSIKIKFMPPVNDMSHFEISLVGGLIGDDSVLIAPQFFKMAFQQNRVDDVPGLISSGDLNLTTGQVQNLTVYARYSSNALSALVGVNPNFPRGPNLPYPVIVFQNPPPSNCPPPTPEQQRIYASAWAEFEQRPDGKLDFTFYGSMFVPLGPTAAWPLNFSGPTGAPATIPASGTVMHPHLQLSTRDPDGSDQGISELIAFNSIQEFTLFTHNSAFGDAFHLNVSSLGGPAKGRSHLLGRLQIQFGGRTGNSVPIAITALPPGGMMSPVPESPITQSFPSRLSAGPQGFNEVLRFPMRNYPLDDLSIIDDPFDISVGAVDLRTGRLLNQLLHRAFISQDLIFALLRVEPCTPQSSFFFRGPALLARGPHNERVFRFQGIVHLPYPEGFKFPNPDFATGFTVGKDSALDPFLWFHALQNGCGSGMAKTGSASRIRSSTGDEFSYCYRIATGLPGVSSFFEYENHTQQGKFRMHSLAWTDFSNSGTARREEGQYDTVSFSGFGIWNKDGVNSLQQVAAQISTSPEKPYVGIQIAAGDISNVNTKPVDEQVALP